MDLTFCLPPQWSHGLFLPALGLFPEGTKGLVDRTTCFPSHLHPIKDIHSFPKLVFHPCLPTFPFTKDVSQPHPAPSTSGSLLLSKSLILIFAHPTVPGPTQTACLREFSLAAPLCIPTALASSSLGHYFQSWGSFPVNPGHLEGRNHAAFSPEAPIGLPQCLTHSRDTITTYESTALTLEGRTMCIM